MTSPSGPAEPAPEPARRRTGRALAAYGPQLALAVPFLVGIVALRGLTETITTFHGSDEGLFHLPTIAAFARGLPLPDLSSYPAAQSPLFHLVMAVASKVGGLHLWALRLLNVAFSYAAVLVLYRLLRRRALGPWPAAALAGLVGISPYVFGASFLLLTDSLALLLVLLALTALDDVRRAPTLSVYLAFCAWTALALLTRQSALWLAPLGVGLLLLSPLSPRDRVLGAGATLAALLPFGALAVSWHGLVPRGSDPASCGVCHGEGLTAVLHPRSVLFVFALVGLYGAIVHGPRLAGARGVGGGGLRLGFAEMAAAVAGAAALLVVPLERGGRNDDGFLWRLAGDGPALLGSAGLFWLLVPVGCALAVALARRRPYDPLPAAYGAAFVVAAVGVALPFQKYFDPFVLLFIALAARPGDLRPPRVLAGPALLAVAFVAYALAASG